MRRATLLLIPLMIAVFGCQNKKDYEKALADAQTLAAEKDSLLSEVLETSKFVTSVNEELARTKALSGSAATAGDPGVPGPEADRAARASALKKVQDLVAHLTGWPMPVPRTALLSLLQMMPSRLRDCAISHGVDAALAVRRAARVWPPLDRLSEQDVPDVLGAIDVFCISSTYEGTPLTLFEAMAAGKTIVSTAVDGCREILQDDVSGLLVPPRDVDA